MSTFIYIIFYSLKATNLFFSLFIIFSTIKKKQCSFLLEYYPIFFLAESIMTYFLKGDNFLNRIGIFTGALGTAILIIIIIARLREEYKEMMK